MLPTPSRYWKSDTKISLEPSVLQIEQPQFSQSVFIEELLPSDHLGDHSLNSLQQVQVLLTWSLQSRMLHSRWGVTRAEGQNYLLFPAGHSAFDTAQDRFASLAKCALLGHTELLIHHHQVLLLRVTRPSLHMSLYLYIAFTGNIFQSLARKVVFNYNYCKITAKLLGCNRSYYKKRKPNLLFEGFSLMHYINHTSSQGWFSISLATCLQLNQRWRQHVNCQVIWVG